MTDDRKKLYGVLGSLVLSQSFILLSAVGRIHFRKRLINNLSNWTNCCNLVFGREGIVPQTYHDDVA